MPKSTSKYSDRFIIALLFNLCILQSVTVALAPLIACLATQYGWSGPAVYLVRNREEMHWNLSDFGIVRLPGRYDKVKALADAAADLLTGIRCLGHAPKARTESELDAGTVW